MRRADSDSECDPPGVFPGGLDPRCIKPNVADANGFIRRIAAALPSMARTLGAPVSTTSRLDDFTFFLLLRFCSDGAVSQVDPEWAEIAQRLVPLPASGGVFTVCDVGSTGGALAPPCNGTASGESNALGRQ